MHRYLSFHHWLSYPGRLLQRRAYRQARHRTDDALAGMSRFSCSEDAPVVLVEGMYNAPNHFFRLKLFLDAVSTDGPIRPIGILRHPNEESARKSLKAIGVDELYYLDGGDNEDDDYLEKATALMKGVETPWDFLNLSFPFNLPAHVVYDTVMKEFKHPQPDVKSDGFVCYVAQALGYLDFYDNLFLNNNVVHVPFSHPWKNEYGIGFWMALHHNVPAYHLTAFYETIRIQRALNVDQCDEMTEKLTHEDFLRLPSQGRSKLIERGKRYLEERIKGETSDINGSRAYNPGAREVETYKARNALDIKTDTPVVLVCAHAWYDFPHYQGGMKLYSDFLEWMTVTLDAISSRTDVMWVLKPHPLESWYGAFHLRDLVDNNRPHIKVIPEGTDSVTCLAAADVVVTVSGTVAIEATAKGKPVIAADRSYYSDWRFAHEAVSQEDYRRLLSQAETLAKPTQEKQQEAAVFAYTALAPHPEAAGLLKFVCDSTGVDACRYVESMAVAEDQSTYRREVSAIADWIQNGSRSYSVDVKLKTLGLHE